MTDADLLLNILKEYGGRVPHWLILERAQQKSGHGMTVHSRAADLRKQGYNVECKVERVNGRAVSYYRLIP